MPYALARPALYASLGEHGMSPNEENLINDVTKRVRLWKETLPYYSEQGYDAKTPESRGTESVLNALILANHDAQQGTLRADTLAAFNILWSQQQREGAQRGSWLWLQFDQEPWEAHDSGYYGAALAALAVGIAPDNYASNFEIQSQLALLRDYLKRESGSQSTINRVFLLWASTKLPGLLTSEEQQAFANDAISKQQPDGGWRLATITWSWSNWTARSFVKMWVREHGTPLRGPSDGVATGLITLVLQEAGVKSNNPQLQKGLAWLRFHQTTEGSWPASSVNKQKHVSSNTGRFMSDAGTAFSVMSLTEAERTRTEARLALHP
jgi:squalene-hopene/tetraprenyl-beta-curcumene cyclase